MTYPPHFVAPATRPGVGGAGRGNEQERTGGDGKPGPADGWSRRPARSAGPSLGTRREGTRETKAGGNARANRPDPLLP